MTRRGKVGWRYATGRKSRRESEIREGRCKKKLGRVRERGGKGGQSGKGKLTHNRRGVQSGKQDVDGGFICDTLALQWGHTVPELFHDGLFFCVFFK